MTSTIPNPLALIAELTHRCPLHCVYCSNPLELQSRTTELTTEVWSRVFKEAAEAGVLQADFTGGEPLARPDIVELVCAARSPGLYVNLITSGLPLDEAKLAALVDAGLDHIQLSFQGAREDTANEISGTKSHAQKLRVLEWLRQHGIAVTLNFVIHRRNVDELEQMLAIAESSCATRIEFANVQYYGWAFANRENLLPTREQLNRSVEFLKRGGLLPDFVQAAVPHVFECEAGNHLRGVAGKSIAAWRDQHQLAAPAAHAGLGVLRVIVRNDKFDADFALQSFLFAFQKFRGEAWMQEPCKTCDRRELDFGGCRCQAWLLAGDAAATDPVCSLSPIHPKVDAILTGINAAPPAQLFVKPAWLYRPNPA